MTKMRVTMAALGIAAFLTSASPVLAQEVPGAGSNPSLAGFLSAVEQEADDAGAAPVQVSQLSSPPMLLVPMEADDDDDDAMQVAAAHGPLPASATVSEAGPNDEPGGPPPPGEHGFHHHGFHHPHILTGALALTDDQYQRFYDLKQSYLDAVGPRVLQKRTLERHLKNELIATDIDTKKVKDIERDLNSVKADLANQRIDHLIAMSQILTPDQRKAIHTAIIKHGFAMHAMGCEGGMHGHHGMKHHGFHHHGQ
ncbi:MAG TPA: periplasmic heavy metal sensor [Chroococcales cyanobacterium]